jgi:hypothetical protein
LKKVFSILFACIFLYNYWGYYITFIIQQYCAKEEMKEQLMKLVPDDELCKINIPFYSYNKIRWYEDNKEFKYEGNMYDVVRQVKTKSSIIYYCVQDNKENKLYQKLNQHVIDNLTNDVNQKNQKEKSDRIIKKVFFDYFYIFNPQNIYKQSQINNKYLFNSALPETNVKDVITPPPEFQS